MAIIVSPFGLNTGGLTVGPFGMTSNAAPSGGTPPPTANSVQNIFFGSTAPTSIYVGSTAVSAVYVGSTLVWEV